MERAVCQAALTVRDSFMAACQTTSTFDFDSNLIQTQGGKSGLSGGIDCTGFIYGGIGGMSDDFDVRL